MELCFQIIVKMKKEKNNKISKSAEKKGNLLIKVDEIMQNFDNEYGPLMLKELENRLMKTISDFQNDVESVLENSFKEHKIKYDNLDQVSSSNINNKDEVPSYISDYQDKKKDK